MARHKRFRRMGRRGFARLTHRSHKRGSFGGSVESLILPAVAYGAARSYLANLAAPLVNKIPLGNYADEALFGVAGWYIAKKNIMGMRKLGEAVLVVEAASVGNQLVAGLGGGQGFSTPGVTFYS